MLNVKSLLWLEGCRGAPPLGDALNSRLGSMVILDGWSVASPREASVAERAGRAARASENGDAGGVWSWTTTF